MNQIGLVLFVGTFLLWSPLLAMTDTGENSPGAGESRSAQGESKNAPDHWGYEGGSGALYHHHWPECPPASATAGTGISGRLILEHFSRNDEHI
jgi:hypothetical protein